MIHLRNCIRLIPCEFSNLNYVLSLFGIFSACFELMSVNMSRQSMPALSVIICIFQNIGFDIANTLCLKVLLKIASNLFIHAPSLTVSDVKNAVHVCLIILVCQQK